MEDFQRKEAEVGVDWGGVTGSGLGWGDVLVIGWCR